MKNNASHNRNPSLFSIRALPLITAGMLMITMQTAGHAQALTSFSDGQGKHAVYIGNDAAVHQLVCSSNCEVVSSWAPQNVTLMASGTATGMESSITSFVDSFGEHIFLIDGAQQINHLINAGGGWFNQPLGVVSPERAISGYSSAGVERIFYETSDQHIHVLGSGNATAWSGLDLTAFTGRHLAEGGSPLASFHDDAGEHLFYVDNNAHINQLYGYWRSSPFGLVLHWANQDLTQQAGGHLALQPGSLSAFSDHMGEHVFYLGADGHVRQLFFGSSWVDQTLASASTPPFIGVLQSGLTSSSVASGEQVTYVGTDAHVYQLFWDFSPWFPSDLTAQSIGPLAEGWWSCGSGASSRVGLELTSLNSPSGTKAQDIFYVADDGNLHDLVTQAQSPGWKDLNLTGQMGWGAQPFNYCFQ